MILGSRGWLLAVCIVSIPTNWIVYYDWVFAPKVGVMGVCSVPFCQGTSMHEKVLSKADCRDWNGASCLPNPRESKDGDLGQFGYRSNLVKQSTLHHSEHVCIKSKLNTSFCFLLGASVRGGRECTSIVR